MILLDTNLLIYSVDPESPLRTWSRNTIADAVADDGACLNAVSLAELCVGDSDPSSVAARIRSWGVGILDLPSAAAEVCARAYLAYRTRRLEESGSSAPRMPLPDFFIGAHAEVMGWPLATADRRRFGTYFPEVELRAPER